MKSGIHSLLLLLFVQLSYEVIVWKFSEDTVSAIEGDAASLKWRVEFTESGESWFSAAVGRKNKTSSEQVQYKEMISKVNMAGSVEETVTLTSRTADMSLNISSVSNEMNVTFILRNLNSSTDDKLYQLTLASSKGRVGSKTTQLNIQVPSSCEIYPDRNITVNETNNVSLNVTTTGNPPVYEYIWTHPNGSRLTANSRLTFTASRQDTGIYNVSVYNGVGDRSYCTRHVTVQFPSSCSIHPDATTVNETVKVSLKITTTGNPPVYEYIWTHPKGSRHSILTFTASRQDTGTYKVSVYNGVGDRSICTSNVTVQYPPVAVTSKLVIIENYQNGSLNCSAPGEPEPTFSWTSTTTRTLLTKDNGRTVVLINATLEDTGNYTCTAKNSLGDSSSTSSVIVAYPVGCTISPDLPNVIVNESGSVTLTCVGKGQPPVNEFFWTYPNGTTHPGTSVLQYRASRTDIKIYHCLVRNSLGRSGNCTRKVSVHFPSSCKIYPNTTTVNEKDKVSLNVTTTGNPPVYEYIWTHPTGSSLTANSTLTFTASRQDTGTYKVSVYNGIDDRTICTSSVTVQFMPRLVNISLIKDPQSTVREEAGTIFAYETDSFNLICESHANPEARYKWTVPDPRLFSELNQQTLLFNDVTKDHSGRYVCTAINIVGEANSSKNLSVYFKPKSTSISISPKQTGFCRGSNATISCTSYAKPPAKYFLYRNTSQIHDNSISGVFCVTLNELGKKNYTCVSYNTVGFGQNRSLELVVKEPPKAENCKVTSKNMINGSVVEGERVTLSCIITGSDPLNITWTNGSHVWNRVNLTFDSVNRENTGNYLVTVNNGKECNETKGENLPLIVYFPSSCEIHPDKNITVNENDTVSLNVTTTGNPPVYEYIWTHPNGRRLTANSRLTFTASRQDTGTYKVSVYNGVGDPGICTSNIAVQYFGELTCEAVPVEVKEGDNIALNCSVTAYPPASYTWNVGNGTERTASNVMLTASLDLHNKSFTCTAENSRGLKKCSTTPLKVLYFKRNICSELNFNLVSGSGSQNLSAVNPTGFGNPIPILTCVGAQVVVSNSKSIITVNTTVPKNVSCTFINKVGNCFRDITVWKRVPAYKKKSTMQILGMDFNIDLKDNNTQAFIGLSKKIKTAILEVYRISGNKYVINIYVITFVEGSVWVNFELELIANVPNPLQPLQDALVQNKGNLSGLMVNESSLSEGFEKPKTSSTTTPTAAPTPTTTESSTPILPTFWEKYRGYIIGAIIGVLALIGLLLLLIWWRYRKKRIEKNPALVNNNNATGDIHAVEGAQARDNDAYSTSDYADRGPSHAEGGKDEPAYAAVDMTKKTKKKKREEKKNELTYAALEDFQPPGGRGGIVLEPLPKGQHTKMPEKYEDTIYAEIVRTKKSASWYESASDASDNIPLSDMHGQGTETKPSDQTADPAKQNDQKRATDEKGKPPDNQGQPPTKEDSGCDARQVYN